MLHTKLSYQMVLNCMEMQLYVIMQEFMALIYLITLLYKTTLRLAQVLKYSVISHSVVVLR